MVAETFQKPKPILGPKLILGKVELLPLPGSTGWQGDWDTLVQRAEQEATALATGGVDALLLENTHDAPFALQRMDAAGAIAMANLARRLKKLTDLPIGIAILPNDPETALAVAVNMEAAFIRVPLLTGARLGELGWMNGRLNELLGYRDRLGLERLPKLLVDISTDHQVPGTGAGETAWQHLRRVADASRIPDGEQVFVVSDERLSAQDFQQMVAGTDWTVLVENRRSEASELECFYENAAGIILHRGIRKIGKLLPGLPPAIDMPRVEAIANRLRKIRSVTEMDPDIFLAP